MLYRITYPEGILEFEKNRGRATITADTPDEAIRATSELFGAIREPQVEKGDKGKYLVNFRVSLDFRTSLLRTIQKSIKLLRNQQLYDEGRYLDRYIVAIVFRETGKPDYLKGIDITTEIRAMRKAAVIAREVHNILSFIDYDICIYNYLELNDKEGYKSRVVREPVKR